MLESSRIEIARELHDGIAQDLVGLAYRVDLLIASRDDCASDLLPLRFAISDLLVKVRDEIFLLRTTKPLREQIAELLREVPSKISTFLTIRSEPNEVQSAALLSIAQELLRNTIKHSHASALTMDLDSSEKEFIFTYRDNGIGGHFYRPSAFGILGIRERVDLLSGSFEISGTNGTTVCIILPK